MEKIKESGSLTDKTLAKNLVKDGYQLSDGLFNKTLLDMEIMGLVKVSWLTKDTRRIEVVSSQEKRTRLKRRTKKHWKKTMKTVFLNQTMAFN